MSNERGSRMTLFFVMMFIFNVATNLVHPVTPSILQNLNLSDYMFGLAFAAMSFCNFLFSPFWGKLNSYIGTRRSLLICSLGYAVGQGLFGLARTEPGFCAARMLAGAFCGGAYVGFLTYVVNCSPVNQRGRNLAVSVTLQTVSTAVGYFIGGMIGEKDIYLPVWIQVVAVSVCGVLFCFLFKDDSTLDRHSLKGKAFIKDCNPFSAFLQCGKYLTPLMIVLFLYYGLSNLGFTAFDQCFNYFIRDQFGFTSKYNGIIKAALGVISLISNCTICMWIMKKGRIARPMVAITAVCTVSMLGVVLVESVVPFVIVNVLFFAFYYISLPLTQNLAAELAKDGDSNLIMGSFNGIKSFGCIFGALFSGFIYEVNARLPFIFGFVAFAVATILAAVYLKLEKKANA